MSDIPENLYFSTTHEWVRLEDDGTITLGITEHAQEEMGDMVYVDFPELGKKIEANGECGVLESVKSASDIYSPLAGEVIAINENLTDNPALINKDCYGDGWIIRLRPDNPEAIKELMDAKAYQEYLAE